MQTLIKEPVTRNAKNTFNAIIDAAIDCFYEKGYHGTSVNTITKNAGVAAGTFYLYFPSKLDLYKHLLIMFSHNIRREIAAKVSRVESRYDKEREGIKAFIELVKSQPHMYNIIWESLYIDRSLFKNYYASFAERYVKGLDHSVESGEIRDVDTEVTSFILMGITNFIGLKVMLDIGQNNDDVDYIVNVVMDLIEHGLFIHKNQSITT